jgi:hypothetical protein
MIQSPNRYSAAFTIIVLFMIFMEGEAKEKLPLKPLVMEARYFLTEWLVKRDLAEAMKYVSSAPVLGMCARTPDLISKPMPTQNEFKNAIKSILKRINNLVPSKPDLAEMIAQTQVISSKENAANGEHFELFSLPKDFNSARFLCKFDENREFRRAFESPDIWYLTFKIENSEASDLSWIISWRKEGNKWLIFSISPLED